MSQPIKSSTLTGDVNGITASREVIGWAVDLDRPETPVRLELTVNGTPHSVTADVPRPDLERKFPGNTAHGFVFPLPEMPGEGWKITVRYAGTDEILPRGEIVRGQPAPPEPAANTGWLKSDVNSPGRNRLVAGWAFDVNQPKVPQEIDIAIGDRVWRIRANAPREDVQKLFPDVPLCGFSWQVPGDVPPGEHPIRITHAASGYLLRRGEGVASLSLRPENTTRDLAALTWPTWPEGMGAVRLAVDCESYSRIDVVVRREALADLQITARSEDPGHRVFDSHRSNREGRPIRFSTRPLEGDLAMVTVRCCLRGPESFSGTHFLGKSRPGVVRLTLRSGVAGDRWLADYLEAVQMTPPLLSFDVAETQAARNEDPDREAPSPHAPAMAHLPGRALDSHPILEDNLFRLLQLFVPGTVPELDALLDGVFGAGDPETLPRLMSIFVNCEPFRPNPPRNQPVAEDTLAFDGWYDLGSPEVAERLEALNRALRLVVLETQYEVSRTRVFSQEAWGPAFVGGMPPQRTFPAFVSEFPDIGVNFLDPAGGPLSAILKVLNISLNGGRPFVIAPDDMTEGPLTGLLAWALGKNRARAFLPHLRDLTEKSLYFRGYVAHRLRCKSAPMIKALAREPSGDAPGGAAQEPDLSVTVVTVSKRPWMIENILQNFDRQAYDHKEHIIVLHGDFDDKTVATVAEAVRSHPGTRLISRPKWLTLGSCLNAAVDLSNTDYVAKFDDDDFYGDRFLSDAMQQIWMSGAEIYTQPLSLIYLEEGGKLVHMPAGSQKSMRLVDKDNFTGFFGSGGTLIFFRSLARQIGFSDLRRGGLDSDWFFRTVSAGHKAHIGGGFNYVFVRRIDKSSHTWMVEDAEFLKTGIVLTEGGTLEQAIRTVEDGG